MKTCNKCGATAPVAISGSRHRRCKAQQGAPPFEKYRQAFVDENHRVQAKVPISERGIWE